MAIKKIAELDSVGIQSLVSMESFAAKMATDDVVADRFRKVTNLLREAQAQAKGGTKIAPKVDDFLYAHAIMMNAAEAALIDPDTGEPLKNAKGESVRGGFENVKDSRGRDSVKWSSPDGIRPYKNANGDIFPEEDLIAKHKEWVGKPLCRDHVSNTVDGVRGIVVDTYYDPKFKRVHALFALDKKNYPDLARKVEAGYATSVSMGTAVGKAICTECANVATVEAEYCQCARSKQAYGEVNKELSPIELSIVVTGADPRAKIKTVLASLKNYVEKKESQFAKLAEDLKLNPSAGIKADMDAIQKDLGTVKVSLDKIAKLLGLIDVGDEARISRMAELIGQNIDQIGDADIDDQTLEDLAKQMRRLNIDGHQKVVDILLERTSKGSVDTIRQPDSGDDVQRHTAQDTAGYSPNNRIGDERDVSLPGNMLPTDNKTPGPLAAFMSFYRGGMEKSGHKSVNEAGQTKISNKVDRNEAVAITKEQSMPMNFAELKERSLRRRTAYHQGTEPAEKYAPMGDSDKIRANEDKQMTGQELDTSAENPDMKVKELHQRASLEERRLRRAALVEKAKTAATGEVKTYKQDGKEIKTVTGPDGKEKTLSQAAKDGKAEDKAEEKKEEKKEEAKNEKKAYYQGTEEPTPGKRKYAPMGDSDKIRDNLDKQMSGQGMESGDDGMHPGYSGKSDEAVKKYWQRMASLKAKRSLGDNIKQAKWDIFADGEKVLTVKAADVYGDHLGAKISEADTDQTYGEFFTTQEYGQQLLSVVREAAGPEGAALEIPGAIVVNAEDAMPPPMAGGPAPEAPKAGGDLEAARDKVLEALSAIEDAVEDVRSTLGVDGLKDVSVDAAPDAEAGEAAPAGPGALAAVESELMHVFAAMTDVADELTMLEGELDDGNSGAMAVVAEALEDADVLVSTAREQIETFAAKKGKKKDEKKDDKAKSKKDEKKDEKPKAKDKADKDDKDDGKKDKKKGEDKEDKPKRKKSAEEALQEMLQVRADRREKMVSEAMEALESDDLDTIPDGAPLPDDMSTMDERPHDTSADDELQQLLDSLEGGGEAGEGSAYDMAVDDDGMCAADGLALDKGEKKEAKEIADKELDKHESDPKMHSHDESKEKLAARKAWRETVAAKAIADLNQTYAENRKGTGAEVAVDANVSGDLALVENLATQQAKDMDVATSQPRNVRMAAETLNGLITKGAIAATDLDELVSKGAVDAEAAKYWKQFYGQVEGGKEFAAGLVKEYKQSKQASVDDTEVREVRMRRAYALGLEAQDRGIITKSRAELEKYVDSMMRLPDEHFEHMKNVVAQMKPAKVATAALQVGVNYDQETQTDATTVRAGGAVSFDDLARIFG